MNRYIDKLSETFKTKSSTITDISNVLTEEFNFKKDKFIGKVLRGRYFLDNRFYDLYSGNNSEKFSFYEVIKPYISQWTLLYKLWNEINEEIKSHQSYLNKLSTQELICYLGTYVEIQNAHKKVDEQSHGIIRKQETDRQGLYISVTGITVSRILNDYLPNKNKSNLVPFNIKEIDLVFYTYNKLDHLENAINLHIYNNYYVSENGNGTITVSPTDIDTENNFLKQKKLLFKLKSDFQYRQNFAETILNLNEVPLFKFEEFSGYNSSNNSININKENIKELCNEKRNYYKYEYLTEFLLLSNYNMSEQSSEDIIIELKKDKSKLNLSELIKVGLAFKFISKLYVSQIDIEFHEKQTYYFKKLNNENSLYRKHNNIMNYLSKLDKSIESNYLKNINNEQQEIEELIVETKDKIFNNIDINKTIVSFNKEEFINIISDGLEIEKENVVFFITLLTSNLSKKTNLNIQPLLLMEDTLFWYPNLFAFTSISEFIYEGLLETRQIDLHKIQSQITENALFKQLKKAGFKIINKEKDRKFIGFDKKKW